METRAFFRNMRKYYFLIILLAAVSKSRCVFSDIHSQEIEKLHHCSAMKNCTVSEEAFVNQQQSRPWLSEIFHEAEKQFTIHPNSTKRCKHDFNLYKKHLANHSLWAVRMFESSEWPKIGILKARKPAFGHYVECTTINVPAIKGQYCMIENVVEFHEFSDTRPERMLQKPREEASAWAAMQLYKYDRARKYRNEFAWALCIPSTCTSADLNLSLRRTFRSVFGKYALRISTNVRQSWCKPSPIKRNATYFYVKYFIGLLMVIILLASIHAHRNDDAGSELRRKIILCFSVQKSYHTLVQFQREREYMLIHVAKAIFSLVAVFMHSVLFGWYEEHYDADALEELSYRRMNQIRLLPAASTSLLLFFGGIFMYRDFERFNEISLFQILVKILKRWLRLFSVVLMVICFYAYCLPLLNDGPLWHRMVEETSHCRINLLPTLLTLPSARHRRMCYVPSWHVAVDFQLYAFNFTCLALIRHYKKSVTKTFSLLTAVSSLWTFYIAYYDHHRAIQFLDIRKNPVGSLDEENSIFSAYMSTVARFGSQTMGISVAAIASQLRERKCPISKIQRIYGSSAAVIVYLALRRCSSYLYEYNFLEGSCRGYSRLIQAFYSAVSYYVSILPAAYLFLIYLVNKFEYFEKRVPTLVVIVSRLSFCSNMCNFIVTQYRLFSRHTHMFHGDSFISAVLSTVPDHIYTLLLSMVLYFLVEAPMKNLVALHTGGTKLKNPPL